MVDTISTNHGGVCLIYRDRLYSRLVNTAHYQKFEHIAVFLHGLSKSLFVVIYRPGSAAAPSFFFDESQQYNRFSDTENYYH